MDWSGEAQIDTEFLLGSYFPQLEKNWPRVDSGSGRWNFIQLIHSLQLY